MQPAENWNLTPVTLIKKKEAKKMLHYIRITVDGYEVLCKISIYIFKLNSDFIQEKGKFQINFFGITSVLLYLLVSEKNLLSS